MDKIDETRYQSYLEFVVEAKNDKEKVKNQGTKTETLTPEQRNIEKLLMGLRLKNYDFPTKGIPGKNLQEAINKGWIVQNESGIRPTLQGTLMLNQLILLLLR